MNSDVSLLYREAIKNSDIISCLQVLGQTIAKGGIDGDDIFINCTEMCTLQTFVAKYVQDMTLGGTVYIHLIRNKKGAVVRWRMLDPRYVTAIQIDNKMPTSYSYHNETILPDDLLISYTVQHPMYLWRGLSKIEALLHTLQADKYAEIYTSAFFENYGLPSAIIRLRQGTQEIEKLQQMLIEHVGVRKRFKAIMTDAIEGIDVVSQSLRDMDFLNLHEYTTKKIYSALGVPKTILGYTDGVNYATAKEQRNIFIENTVRPYEYDIADLLSAISKNLGKKQIKVIDAHNTDIQVRAEIYQKMFDAGVLTMNEFKILYGLEPSKSAYANEHIIDKNKMLLSDIDISPVITIPSLP